MTEQLPEYPHNDAALVNVVRAHTALEKINAEIDEAVKEATRKINAQYTPMMYAAQSVLYEAMGQASGAGFTYRELCEVMQCANH
jgi:hypothetical protein